MTNSEVRQLKAGDLIRSPSGRLAEVTCPMTRYHGWDGSYVGYHWIEKCGTKKAGAPGWTKSLRRWSLEGK